MNRGWLASSCVIGFLAVSGGAFGAHLLRGVLLPASLDIWNTGARYALAHAVLLVVVSVLPRAQFPPRLLAVSWWSLFLGVCVFTGSLWLLAVTGIGVLGAITPLGGLGMLTGWVSVAVAGWRGHEARPD